MRRKFSYLCAQGLIRITARVLWGLEVEGLEYIPPQGRFILAANHKSYLDPPILGAPLRRAVRYFAKKQLFSIPVFGRIIAGFGAIPIDREGFDRKGIVRALECLEAGDGLVVFPEGTRIRRPGFGSPRDGIGMLILRSGAPVVPAFLASTWEPRRSLFRRIPVRVRYGPPLEFPRAKGPEARARYPDVAAAVLDAIARLGEAPPPAPPNPV